MARNFDGVDDSASYGDIAAIDGAAALTVLLWAKRDGNDASEHLISKGRITAGVNCSFAFGADTGAGDEQKLRVDLPNGTTGQHLDSDNDNFGSSDGWQHLGFVFNGAGATDADKLKLYVDAVLQAATVSGTLPATISTSTASLKIGTSRDDDNFFDGQIALVKIWTAALSITEIAAERFSYRPRRTSNLLLFVPADDGALLRDYAGKINPTVVGTTDANGPPVGIGAGMR